VPDGVGRTVIANRLALLRTRVLGSGAKLTFIRVSDPLVVEKPIKLTYNRSGTAAATTSTNSVFQTSDQAHACVLIPYSTALGVRRFVTLSGVPDAYIDRVDRFEEFELTAAGREKLDIFYIALGPSGLQHQCKVRLDSAGFTKVAVNEVHKHADGYLELVVASTAGLVSGDRVTFTKMKGVNLAGLKGQVKVRTVINATQVTLHAGVNSNGPEIHAEAGGKMQKVGYGFTALLASHEDYIISTRKRGRIFSPRRGRRSAAK
jgi:hypothetical protein